MKDKKSKFKRISPAAKQARSRNITPYNQAVRAGNITHPALKHGAYSRQIRKRDKRTTEGKELATIMRDLSCDYGPDLSAGQNLILSRIREKLIVLMQIGKFCDSQSSIISGEGELLPCLGRNYTSYSEALRRDLEALQKFANNKVPGDLYEKWRSEFFKDAVEPKKEAKK